MNKKNDRFLRACRREPVDCTPIWMMRQAGRYMEEYRVLRRKHDFLTMCKTPELATAVTLQPVDKVGVDAAILFADILLPLEGMGLDLTFGPGEGPIIHNPVRTQADVAKLRPLAPDKHVPYVMEAVRTVRKELGGRVPLIGFSGAPFTLASYVIEGGHSRNYENVKSLMYGAPDVWHALMDKIADVVIVYLNAQIEAGAQAVQIFDSWVGCLAPFDYGTYVLRHSQKVIANLETGSVAVGAEGADAQDPDPEGVPVIHFGANASHLLDLMKAAGGDVIGVDWRTDLDAAWERLGFDTAIQGNLDPTILFAPVEVLRERARDILDRAAGRPGHIFNLGHGILPATPVENAIALVEFVHEYSRRSGEQGDVRADSPAGADVGAGAE